MVIFNEVHHNNKGEIKPLPHETVATQLPEWQQKLHDLIQYCIEHTPPKELGRSIRTYFLLLVSGFKTIDSQWEDLVLEIITILELIDDVEDGVMQ